MIFFFLGGGGVAFLGVGRVFAVGDLKAGFEHVFFRIVSL